MTTLYNYVDSPNANLVCCICRMPFLDPVTSRTCSHTFCELCITQALSHASHCPIDRSPLVQADLLPANPIVRSLVDELVVECPNRLPGCDFTCQRQLISGHINESCPFENVVCPSEDCDQLILRKDASKKECTHKAVRCDHCGKEIKAVDLQLHEELCLPKTTSCEFCDEPILRKLLSNHHDSCPRFSVPCSQASHGCPWTGPRESFDGHTSACPYEAIKGFFVMHSSVVEENLIMRRKVDTLEGLTHTMKHEIFALQHALGPWYKPYLHDSSAELPISLQPFAASSSGAARQPPPSETSAVPSDEFSAYFPVDQPSTGPPMSPPVARSTIEQMPYPYAPGHQYRYSINSGYDLPNSLRQSQLATSIAPLDISSTLEASLTGLRESLVSLGSSVDSLSRRSDIALSNETLRLNEDIMALRAIIHGLRMQVHSIMMERNAQVAGLPGQMAEQLLPPRLGPPTMSPPGPPTQSITKL